jgi:LmeA-like phospholipid-binding
MGARAVVVSTVALVALAAGAYAGDRWALREVEDRVAEEVRTGVAGVTGQPDVHIDGFPFLTQLARGSLDDVTVAVASASLSGVELQDVDVRAEGVSTREPYQARDAVVTGTLTTATLERLVAERTDADVALAVDGGRLTATLQVLRSDVTAELLPAAAGDAIEVDVVRVTIAGAVVDVEDLPGAASSRLQDLEVPIEGLPPGLTLSDVVVQDDGLRVTATGTDVTLPERS